MIFKKLPNQVFFKHYDNKNQIVYHLCVDKMNQLVNLENRNKIEITTSRRSGQFEVHLAMSEHHIIIHHPLLVLNLYPDVAQYIKRHFGEETFYITIWLL